MEKLAEIRPFPSLDDVRLDRRQSPTIEGLAELIVGRIRHWVSSRLQSLDHLENRLTELLLSSSIGPPVKSLTDFSAGQPKFDPIRFLNCRILHSISSNLPVGAGRKQTLIVVRRRVAAPRTSLTGFTFAVSLA